MFVVSIAFVVVSYEVYISRADLYLRLIGNAKNEPLQVYSTLLYGKIVLFLLVQDNITLPNMCIARYKYGVEEVVLYIVLQCYSVDAKYTTSSYGFTSRLGYVIGYTF